MAEGESDIKILCYYEKIARKIKWPNPDDKHFKKVVEKMVESAKRQGCPDSLLAHYLHLFLLSEEKVMEPYAILCDRINFGDLSEIIYNLNSLGPMAERPITRRGFDNLKSPARTGNPPQPPRPHLLHPPRPHPPRASTSNITTDISDDNLCLYEKIARKTRWPNPDEALFIKMVEKAAKSAQQLGCPDSFLAHSLHQFLLSNEKVGETYAILCDKINFGDLAEIISNLDSLDLMAKYRYKKENFVAMRPKSGDNSLMYMQRLIAKADEFFGKETNSEIWVPLTIRTQFLESCEVNGAKLNRGEKERFSCRGDLKELAVRVQQILEERSTAHYRQ